MNSRFRLYARKYLTWYRQISFIFSLFAIDVLFIVIGRLDRSIDLDNLRLIVLIAAFLGLAISLIRNPNSLLVLLLSFSSGVIVTFSITGNLLQPFLKFLQSGYSYIIALINDQFFLEKIHPDLNILQDRWHSLTQSISVLYNRLFDWLLFLPESAYDPVSINLAWGILVWLATIWVFWFVIKRKRALVGFLPPLGIIAGSVPSIESRLFLLALILVIGLLLLVLGNQANQEEYWENNRFTTSERIRGIAAQYAVFLSVALVLFASLITSPKLDDFIKERRQKNQSSSESNGGEFVAPTMEEQAVIGADEVLKETALGGLPNNHLVGSGPDLEEIEIFYAKIENPSMGLAPRYYFRSATYETFSINGWRNIRKDIVLVPPEEEFEISITPNQHLIFQEVTLLRESPKGNLMFVVGELAATNVSYYGSYHTKFVNNTYADLFASVTNELQYRAYSVFPNFGEDDLRNTSQEYLSWIENKYLQIPGSTPGRVYDLAIDLTATQPTPYDRALAIESYLREFEYTLDIDTPPKNRDIVDYFLFDLQKGYCDYYASAMVVLARAAGIPARLATGYLVSTYDLDANQFIVTGDQAHSWAELYFPEYGWVTFEPTAGRPALERPSEREVMQEELASDFDFDVPLKEPKKNKFNPIPQTLFVVSGELASLLILGLIAFHWIDQWRLRNMDPIRMFSRLYHRLRNLVNGIGVKSKPADTPQEFSVILKAALKYQGESKFLYVLLNSTSQNADFIIAACNHAAYTNRKPEDEEISAAISVWGHLRWQLLLVRIQLLVKSISALLKRVWLRSHHPARF